MAQSPLTLAWVAHVKKTQSAKGCSYTAAMKAAAKTWGSVRNKPASIVGKKKAAPKKAAKKGKKSSRRR